MLAKPSFSLHLIIMPDFICSIATICKSNNDVDKIPFRQLNNKLKFLYFSLATRFEHVKEFDF